MKVLHECSFRPKINRVSKSIDENCKRRKIKIGELIEGQTTGMMGSKGLETFAYKTI